MEEGRSNYQQIISENVKKFLQQTEFIKLRNTWIVNYELVYVSGIPSPIAKEELLKSK